MSGIDWPKAPEWATKYGTAGPQALHCWFNEEQYVYTDDTDHHPIRFGDKSAYARERDQFTVIAERPSPAWSGEGKPPVGTVCEWREKTGFQWVKATVLFITDCSVVMQRSDGFEWQMMTARTVFRPFRTPEQIAADEREAAIKAACLAVEDKIEKYNTRLDCSVAIRATIDAMIDAGYRKP